MSYHQNQSQPDSAIPAIIAAVALVVVVAVASLSKSIADALGADFWVVLYALGHSAIGILLFDGLVIGAAYLGLFHNLGCVVGLIVAMTASVVWWCFGTVLDSMALGGQNPASATAFHFGDPPIWDTWWFQWGGSGLLLVCVVAAGWCALNDN